MPVIVVSRFAVPDQESAAFTERARAALAALAGRPGFRRGRVGRSVDEPAEWVLVTEWDGVGAYRRALSAYEVRVAATPLLAQARDEPGAFEVLVSADGAGAVLSAGSDRAPDAETAAPGRGLDGPLDGPDRAS
ncbi:MAG TPA: antibiotic biosynthesis monooxygenase [Mycobacteriales bacterium]|nr:antibiotic biosynthesis monooxygenase [Mycobacteriales bacterium]